MGPFGQALGGGRREDSREPAPLSVVLATVSKSYTAELVDISATGARICGDDLPAHGLEMFVTVGRVKTFCTVRWTGDRECGVQFYEPLLQAEVTALRHDVAASMSVDPAIRAAMEDWVIGVAR